MKKVEQIMPWMAADGTVLPLDQIRELSKSWDQSTWEAYLSSLEGRPKEKYFSDGRLRRESKKKNINIFDFSQNNADEETRQRIQKIISYLTDRQRQVIEMTYWENLSQREIAQKLSIHQSTVLEIKQQALKKLREIVSEYPVSLPIVKGQVFSETTKEEQDAQKDIGIVEPKAI